MPLDDDSARWLDDLRAERPSGAQARLFAMLLRAARTETNRRSARLQVTGAELDDLAHQAAADALLAVLGRLSDFRGDSRFTTWAYKFVIFEVSAKIGRHFWARQPAVPLQESDEDRLPARFGFSPEHEAEWRELVDTLRHALDTELTERQRQVFRSIVLDGVPLDALCVELGTNRNAVYKTLFDARVKLRAALVAKGHLREDTWT